MTISGLPANLADLAAEIHRDNIAAGWWKQEVHNLGTAHQYYSTEPRNIGELLCLVHSEISEADEGMECSLMDDKLPHRPMPEVELADTAIRVLDILGYYLAPVGELSNHVVPVPRLPWPVWCRMMHRKVSEAMERFRKGDSAKGCRHLNQLLWMLNDASLQLGFDLSGAIAEKRAFNAQRADHKPENREKDGGKKF